jgi:adenylyltransferase and sulfurtransferase
MEYVIYTSLLRHSLNSDIVCEAIEQRLSRDNAWNILARFGVVVDATDNAATRYLINDVCVLQNKPLVSGSALRGEGQLTTYHYHSGPCYRCLFPVPPPAETVTNCSDGGVLGVVVGIIGTLQALEVLRLILDMAPAWSQKMVLLDGFDSGLRTIKLRGRRDDCAVCGGTPTVNQSLLDYEDFCGTRACDLTQAVTILDSSERINATQLSSAISSNDHCVIVDTRPQVQFDICSLPKTLNVPMKMLQDTEQQQRILDLTRQLRDQSLASAQTNARHADLIFLCRRGNDSQYATRQFKQLEAFSGVIIKDVEGGLEEWARVVDPSFPKY